MVIFGNRILGSDGWEFWNYPALICMRETVERVPRGRGVIEKWEMTNLWPRSVTSSTSVLHMPILGWWAALHHGLEAEGQLEVNYRRVYRIMKANHLLL